MRALRHLLLIGVFLLAVTTAGQANADITVPNNIEGAKEAFDGDDYYSFTYGKQNRSGNGASAVLWRRSVSSGSKHRVAAFRAAHGVVSQVEAGGGRVAVGMQKFNRGKIRSRIVAMNRDGSQSSVLATGLTGNPFVDAPYNACGKFPWIQNVSSEGATLLSETNQVRRGSKCRFKSSVLNWRFVEVAADGRRRILDSGQYAPGLEDSTNRWVSVQTEGDYAAFVEEKKLRVYVKNLVTGATTGPFADSTRLNGRTASGVGVSLGRNGMLAIVSSSASSRSRSTWTDVFSNPLDPRTAARSKAFNEVQFCGARLLTFDYQEDNKSAVMELDPSTLAPIGKIAEAGAYEWIQSCSATHVVVGREGKLAGTVLHSVALPGQ